MGERKSFKGILHSFFLFFFGNNAENDNVDRRWKKIETSYKFET